MRRFENILSVPVDDFIGAQPFHELHAIPAGHPARTRAFMRLASG